MVKNTIIVAFLTMFILIGMSTSTISSNKNDVIVVEKYKPIHKEINVDNFKNFIKFYNPDIGKYLRKRISNVILNNAEKYNIDPIILLSVLAVESNYKHTKIGSFKEKGIGQIYPKVWFDKNNDKNLYIAGIIKPGEEYQLFWIGKNIESTAYILNTNKKICTRYDKFDTLYKRGYKSTTECMIRKYNGSGYSTIKYFINVSSIMGQYYIFVKNINNERNI